MFVNYAHRGASHYYPENTISSFAAGIDMGADGIETDVQRTKDGVLVIYHDDSTKEKIGFEGSIADYTWEELRAARVHNARTGKVDCLVAFEDFLKYFGWRELTFAIELKVDGIAEEVIDLLRKYNMTEKSIITSFNYQALTDAYEYDKTVRLGWLYCNHDENTIKNLHEIKAYQACPQATKLTPENLEEIYKEGFECRAWGIGNTDIMMKMVEMGVNGGMTVNFPDKLSEYLKSRNENNS